MKERKQLKERKGFLEFLTGKVEKFPPFHQVQGRKEGRKEGRTRRDFCKGGKVSAFPPSTSREVQGREEGRVERFWFTGVRLQVQAV